MKYLLSFIIAVFVFTGCAQKEQVVEMKPPKNDIGKPIIKPESKIEEVEEIEVIEVEEEEVPFLESQEQIKIAFVYPSKYVAKYAKSSISTIMGYLSYRKANYNFKVIDTKDENILNLQNTFQTLKDEGFTNVIGLFTPRANELLQTLELDDMRVYLPLIEKNDLVLSSNNFIYGSISYDDQIKNLLEYSQFDKKTMFYQDSFLGKKLKSKFDTLPIDFRVQKMIKKKRNYFRGLIKDYRLNNSAVFLNTDIVKTSLILSQMTVYNIHPKVVMSTQNNYDPKLISLTQERDRKNFIVSNSIGDVNDDLLDTLETFGSNVKYEWVDYSVLVGINYLYDSNFTNLVSNQIEDNKVIYIPRLYRSTDFGFLEIK